MCIIAAVLFIVVVDPASQLLLSFSDAFSDVQLTDELLDLLCTEVITRKTQAKIKESGYLLVDESLRSVCATVAEDHNKLKVLADVLSKFKQTASLAINLISDYGMCVIIMHVNVLQIILF